MIASVCLFLSSCEFLSDKEKIWGRYADLPDAIDLDNRTLEEWTETLDISFARREAQLQNLLRVDRNEFVPNSFSEMASQYPDVFDLAKLSNSTVGWQRSRSIFGVAYYPRPAVRLECGMGLESLAFVSVVPLRGFGATTKEGSGNNNDYVDNGAIKLIAAADFGFPEVPEEGDIVGSSFFGIFGDPPPELPFHPISPAGQKLWAELCNHLAKRIDALLVG